MLPSAHSMRSEASQPGSPPGASEAYTHACEPRAVPRSHGRHVSYASRKPLNQPTGTWCTRASNRPTARAVRASSPRHDAVVAPGEAWGLPRLLTPAAALDCEWPASSVDGRRGGGAVYSAVPDEKERGGQD